jgi:hypothetical protein
MRILVVILVLLPQVTWGQQNLVPNGSFEEITSCPNPQIGTTAQIELAFPWLNDIGGTELYHACSPPLIFGADSFPSLGVPENAVGVEQAHSGEAYGGIYTYGGINETNGREYLQVPLIQTLHSGRYEVSFWASLADEFDYAVGSLGAYFSDTLVTRTSFNSLPGVEPSIQSPPGQIFSDKDLWYLITDTFTSRVGGERYIAIGNFKSTAESDTLFVPTGDHNRLKSYYYIDDVSVIALDSMPNGVGEAEPLAFKVWPNPAQNHITITAPSALTAASVFIYSISGQRLVSGAYDAQIDISSLPNGIYFIELRNETSIARQRFVKM